MADNTAVYTGTGRRKEAVARVRLIPGTGKVTVNGREATQYFGRQQLVDNATAPLRITDTLGRKQGMKLKVYAGAEHPHAAQNPVKIELEG